MANPHLAQAEMVVGLGIFACAEGVRLPEGAWRLSHEVGASG